MHRSEADRNSRYSICIVARELAYLFKNGGIGTSNWTLANLLAQQGWRVHILYCGPGNYDKKTFIDVKKRLEDLGCAISTLDQFAFPRTQKLMACNHRWFLELSDNVRYALEELDRQYSFDLIEFADYQGVGFRTLQAKRSGLAFRAAHIVVKLHSPSLWIREANLKSIDHVSEFELDCLERYSFENADWQVSPSRYMLDFVRSKGWRVSDSAHVVSAAYPEPDQGAESTNLTKAPAEVVFFGRLETRKGLELFVDAVSNLDPQIAITFLGKDTTLSNGTSALRWIKHNLANRKVTCLTGLDQRQAIQYLREGNRLAVMPSLLDNFPNTVIECAVNGIPFLASQVGGIPEILPDQSLHAKVLFAPNPKDLRHRISSYLAAPEEERRLIQQKIEQTVARARNNERVWQQYAAMACNSRTDRIGEPSSLPATAQPLVTVCIACDDMPDFLPQALASLAKQTYPNLKVLVVYDCSTNFKATRIFDEQQRLYPQFHFIRQQDSNIGAAFDLALRESNGEFFIPMNSSMIAAPEMVESFVKSIRHNPDLSALICYGLACGSKNEMRNGRCAYAYRPTGWPHVTGHFETDYGETSGVFRTAHLLALRGFHSTRCDGREVCMRLVDAGKCVDVIPKHLFFYYRQLAVHARLVAQIARIRGCRQLFEALPIIWLQASKWTKNVAL